MAREKTKLEQYQDLQALVQKDARDVAERVYEEKAAKYRVAEVPFHKHNGFDSPKVSEDDIIITNKLNTQFQITNTSGAPYTETFTLRNVKNVSRITFHGYAANNAAAPATLRAVIDGEVIFGKCNVFTGSGVFIDVTTIPPGTPFVQGCSSMYIDSTNLANTRVGTAPYLAVVFNPGGVIVSLILDSYTNNSLTFTAVLDTDWKLEGNVIIE